MKKFVDWILAHKVKTGFIIFAIFVFPLIVIHFLYKWQTPHFLLQSSWSSGELITYIAGFEAFIGTVFLGAVAVRQNDKVIEINESMIKREEKRDAFSRQPTVMISNWQINYVGYKDIESEEYDARVYKGIFDEMNGDEDKTHYRFLQVSLSLINSSKTNIEFTIDGLDIVGKRPDQFELHYGGYSLNAKFDFYHLSSNATVPFTFLLEDNINVLSMYKECQLELSLSNTIGEKYKEKIEFLLFGIRPDFIAVYPGNYSIYPFDQESK